LILVLKIPASLILFGLIQGNSIQFSLTVVNYF